MNAFTFSKINAYYNILKRNYDVIKPKYYMMK